MNPSYAQSDPTMKWEREGAGALCLLTARAGTGAAPPHSREQSFLPLPPSGTREAPWRHLAQVLQPPGQPQSMHFAAVGLRAPIGYAPPPGMHPPPPPCFCNRPRLPHSAEGTLAQVLCATWLGEDTAVADEASRMCVQVRCRCIRSRSHCNSTGHTCPPCCLGDRAHRPTRRSTLLRGRRSLGRCTTSSLPRVAGRSAGCGRWAPGGGGALEGIYCGRWALPHQYPLIATVPLPSSSCRTDG